MLFEITIVILAVLIPVFFLFGFYCGARKSVNPNAPLIPKKHEKQSDRYEQLSKNISNYVGDSTNQVAIEE